MLNTRVHVTIDAGFWAERRRVIREKTVPHIWAQFVAHGYIDALLSAERGRGPHRGFVFGDSDVCKWLEAVAYLLKDVPEDEFMSDAVDQCVDLFERAQRPDGYVNSFMSRWHPRGAFRNHVFNHETYCAGHLIEAGCALAECAGDERLLEVGRRFADFVGARVRSGQWQVLADHPEIELALVRLYGVTGDHGYASLAADLIARRGTVNKYPQLVLKGLAGLLAQQATRTARQLSRAGGGRCCEQGRKPQRATLGFAVDVSAVGRATREVLSGRYTLDDRPLSSRDIAEGHAVRAMYLLAGAADVAVLDNDRESLSRLKRIWERTIARRTYVTGGMGSVPLMEGFGEDYELPNECYAETCAAVGAVLFGTRLLAAQPDVAVADWVERILYNAVLGGIDLGGTLFAYRNTLATWGSPSREPWFRVACCPPNVARLVAGLGRHVMTRTATGVALHLHVSGDAEIAPGVLLRVRSELPWSGRLTMQVEVEGAHWDGEVLVRIPGWARAARLAVGQEDGVDARSGEYARLVRRWHDGDTADLFFEMPVEYERAPWNVVENRGRVAIRRGPIVYCVEEVDNSALMCAEPVLALESSPRIEERPGVLGGIVAIRLASDRGEVVAVPYFAHGNRGSSRMAVWVRATEGRGV